MNTRHHIELLIQQARDSLQGALSSYHSIFSEKIYTYIFPSDLSGRLTRLQSIVGNYDERCLEEQMKDEKDFNDEKDCKEQKVTEPKAPSLWKVISQMRHMNDDENYINDLWVIDCLAIHIGLLETSVHKVQGLPPPKEKLKKTIELVTEKLKEAKESLEKISWEEEKCRLQRTRPHPLAFFKSITTSEAKAKNQNASVDFIDDVADHIDDDTLNFVYFFEAINANSNAQNTIEDTPDLLRSPSPCPQN